MASDKSIDDDNTDSNTASNQVPAFLIRRRPAPAVCCPNIGFAKLLLGTHIIYTVENKVCVGRLLSEDIGNDDQNMVNINVYNIVNASPTLDICKRGINEVIVTQTVVTINTVNITDIAFILHDDEFEKYPDLIFINNVYRVSKYATGQTIDNFKSFSSEYYDLNSIKNLDTNNNIELRAMMSMEFDFCYEIFLSIIRVLKAMHINLCKPSADQGNVTNFKVDVPITKAVFCYLAWSLEKTVDETDSRKRTKYDRCVRHNLSYYRTVKTYETTGFRFVNDSELKKLASVFGLFCLLGIRKAKPNKVQSPLVLKVNNKLNIVCSPTPSLRKTGVQFSFCQELGLLRIIVYYSAHIYGEEEFLDDISTNDDANDSTNDSTKQRWYERHNGWILTGLRKKKESVSDLDTAIDTTVDESALIRSLLHKL